MINWLCNIKNYIETNIINKISKLYSLLLLTIQNSNKNSFTFGFSHSSVDHETDKSNNQINHENPNKIIDYVPNNNDNYNTNSNHYAPKKKPLYLGVVGDGVAPNSVTEKYTTQWGYQLLPTLYSVYQKVLLVFFFSV
jgi:hypothetical protein